MLTRSLRDEPRDVAMACRSALSPQQSENRGLAWVIGAFLICPCHLPLTLALAGSVLAGTTAGVLLRAYPLASSILITAAWAAATWRGIRYLGTAKRYAASRMTHER